MKLPFVVIVPIIFAPLAYADVPHSFSAGTPAGAQQVNENFAAVDANTTALQDQYCGSSGFFGLVHTASYAPKSAAVGDEIIMNGHSYRMIRVPFVEHGSGDRYTVTMPAAANAGNEVNTFLYVTHSGSDATCSNLSVSGFPSRYTVHDDRTITVRNDGSAASTSKYNVSMNLNVKVGESVLFINFPTARAAREGSSTTVMTWPSQSVLTGHRPTAGARPTGHG